MTAPSPKPAVSDSVKEGVFRFLADFREGYDATSFGVYYQGFSLMQDARHMEEVGHIAELRFHRDRTGRIDGMELVRLSPKPPALRVVDGVTWSQSRGSEPIKSPDDENGSIEGGEQSAVVHERDTSQAVARYDAPSDLDSQPSFCRCGHPEDEHYQGGVCQKIEGVHVCGCEHFVQEAA